jgi:hypothetical protein
LRRRSIAAACVLSVVVFSGCAGTDDRKERVAPLTHVVLFDLEDPSDIEPLKADIDGLLSRFSGIGTYSFGHAIDGDDPRRVTEYDVACSMTFPNPIDLGRYREWDEHRALIEKWKSRLLSVKTADFIAQNPPPQSANR